MACSVFVEDGYNVPLRLLNEWIYIWKWEGDAGHGPLSPHSGYSFLCITIRTMEISMEIFMDNASFIIWIGIDIKVRVPWGSCPWRLAVLFLTELILAGLYSRLGSSSRVGSARGRRVRPKKADRILTSNEIYHDIPVLLNLILICVWDLLLRKYPRTFPAPPPQQYLTLTHIFKINWPPYRHPKPEMRQRGNLETRNLTWLTHRPNHILLPSPF